VKELGSLSFEDCVKLAKVEFCESESLLEEGLVELGRAFPGCSSLTQIKIPSSVKTICREAFRDCTSLTSIKIPPNVECIGIRAFGGCKHLSEVELCEGLTEIRFHAFQDCTALTCIKIPSTVKKIDATAFEGCGQLAVERDEGKDSTKQSVASLPTDEAIFKEIEAMVKSLDIENMSIAQFLTAVSNNFGGIDLSSKKKFILANLREIVNTEKKRKSIPIVSHTTSHHYERFIQQCHHAWYSLVS